MSTSIQEQDLIQTIKQLEQRIADMERQQRTIKDNNPQLSIAQGQPVLVNITNSIFPATPTNPCQLGEMAVNTNELYICVATNTWRKTTLSTF